MRLIDADVLKEELIKALHEPLMDIDEAIDVLVTTIDDAPTVDAVEVVRCKDCKHNYHNMIPSGEAEHECVKCVELPITADFYCAWGEREDEVTE